MEAVQDRESKTHSCATVYAFFSVVPQVSPHGVLVVEKLRCLPSRCLKGKALATYFRISTPLECLGKSCRQFAMLRADLRLESVGGGAGVAQELRCIYAYVHTLTAYRHGLGVTGSLEV